MELKQKTQAQQANKRQKERKSFVNFFISKW